MLVNFETLRHSLAGRSAGVAAIISSIAAWVASEVYGAVQTGEPRWGLIAIIVALSGATGSFFASLPRIITARGNANTQLLQELQRELKRRTITENLIRVSKHNALTALQAAYWHLDDCEDLAREHGIQLPEFRRSSVNDIFGDEDEQLKRMALEASKEVAAEG